MYLCSNGRNLSQIIVSRKASKIELFAADQLRHYLQQMSGMQTPVGQKPSSELTNLFLSCDPALSKAKEDTFEIKIDSKAVHLNGQNPRGVLYAVYSFLEEELGVGFLAPGLENEWIPSLKTIEVKPTKRRESPVMNLRGYSCRSVDEIDWMAKNKMNFCLMDLDKKQIPQPQLQKRGLKQYCAGHSFYLWVPPEKYWKKHPEYYALINGKRICTYQHSDHMGHQQLCLSNPDVIKIAADNICRFIENNPNYEFITIWPEDAPNFCQCSECQNIDKRARPLFGHASNAGVYIYFVQKVAERVGKRYPEKKLNAIAYNTTFYPPTNPEFYVPPNVVLEVAFWGRFSDKPLGEKITEAQIKKRVEKAGIPLERLDEFKRHYRDYEEILKGWTKLTRGDLLIYDYAMASGSTLSLPYPSFASMVKDQKFYKQIRVTGCYMQAHKDNHVAYGLNYWCGAKAYWSGYRSPDMLLEQWCNKMFGPGAHDMKRYYETLETSFRQVAGWYYAYTPSRIITQSVIERGSDCLNSAWRKVRNPKQKYWLENVRLHFAYAGLMREFFDMSRQVEYLCDAGKEEKAFDAMMDLYAKTIEINKFLPSLKGRDILNIGRTVLYTLLKQEVQAYDLTRTLGTVEAGEKMAQCLWPKLYDKIGW